ncbi:DUF982 domain-containing protein [Mesorhizobium sp. RP14(2022)]|uniref:DUF982 domain-containing protein n=1 Tax=Mesorhizobium liriopis TaxID=2953882 RepID=A0ABT1C515_9HYPH|nr:DUF982 domain-containing protein [Mesorhizobium liriopis]MCO6049920.1 DUF982 domain-containing protein [Mesorhizobium liriopis]
MSDPKLFSKPITVEIGGESRAVATVQEASELLSSTDWPDAGPLHRDALGTCMKVLDGHRSTVEAEEAFTQAAREAGLLRP